MFFYISQNQFQLLSVVSRCFCNFCHFWVVINFFCWLRVRGSFKSLPHNLDLSRLWKRSLLTALWEKKKCWKSAFSLYSAMFSTLPNLNFSFLVTFILSSAYAFNLDKSKILSFGMELNGTEVFINFSYFRSLNCLIIPFFRKVKILWSNINTLALWCCLIFYVEWGNK